MHGVKRLGRSNLICAAALACAGLVAPPAAALPGSASQARTTTAQKPPARPAAKPAQTRSSVARARAAAAARARQLAAERKLREAMTPKYKRDLLGNQVPDIRAAAAIVFEPGTNTVLWEQNSQDQRSIASLTKLMTAVTFMADDPNLDERVAVTTADTRSASVTYIRARELITYRDLLHLTLVASDNAAARVLARTSEGGTAAFITRMNEMALHLGMTNTHYTDPSGLDARNVSSAYDISHLMAYAAADPVLGPVMRTSEHTARTNLRTISVRSTNKLLGIDELGVDVLGGKTGFIRKAGYCLATLLRIPEGPQVAVVVLGAADSTLRFWETRHLLNWVVGRSTGLIGGDDPK